MFGSRTRTERPNAEPNTKFGSEFGNGAGFPERTRTGSNAEARLHAVYWIYFGHFGANSLFMDI